MGNYVFIKGKIFLRCNNRAMNFFYENILAVAHEMQLDNNPIIMGFIAALDQDTYGLGCIFIDLVNFIKSSSDLGLLKELVKNTVKKIAKEKICTPESLMDYQDFNDKLALISFEDIEKH